MFTVIFFLFVFYTSGVYMMLFGHNTVIDWLNEWMNEWTVTYLLLLFDFATWCLCMVTSRTILFAHICCCFRSALLSHRIFFVFFLLSPLFNYNQLKWFRFFALFDLVFPFFFILFYRLHLWMTDKWYYFIFLVHFQWISCKNAFDLELNWNVFYVTPAHKILWQHKQRIWTQQQQ